MENAMKKSVLLVGMLVFLASATSLMAQQTNPQPPPQRPMMHQYRGMMMQGNRLNLTADQKTKMQNLRLQLTKELLPLRSQMKEKEDNLKLQITSDKYSSAAVNKTLDEISSLQKQIRMKMIDHLRSVRSMLTPDQQKKFDMMVLSGRWSHHAMARSWSMHRNGWGMGHGNTMMKR